MGVSTNAILFYGIDLGGEDPDIEDIVYDSEKGEYIDSKFVGVGKHCSGSYPMHYVYIKASRITACRGYPEVIHGGNTKRSSGNPWWDMQIKTFCEEHNLPYEEPRWLLCSYWDQ